MEAKSQITACTLCLLAALAICTPAHAQWTEPVLIPSDLGLMTPRSVTVGDTIHVVAFGSVHFYYLRSNDNGTTWTEPVRPPNDFYRSYMPDISFSNNLIHIVFVGRFQTQQPLHVYHMSSSDGGRTWSEPQLIHDEGYRHPRFACKGDTLFVSSYARLELYVLSSFDNGETWNESVPAEYMLGTIPPANIMYSNGRIHLVYQHGVQEDTTGWEIYHRYSDDLGLTWSDRYGLSTLEHWQEGKHSQSPSAYADSNGNIIALWMDYKYGGACGIPTGDILGRVSRDNGETWLPETRLTYTQTGRNSSCLILNDRLYAVWADYYYFYCTKGKIMYSESSDWGGTWNDAEIISGLIERDEILPIILSNRSGGNTILHCIMCGQLPNEPSYLYYFYNDDLTEIGSELIDNIPQYYLLSAYPNPFNSSTVISYSNLEGDDIKIFDITGKLVKSINIKESKEGKTVWDGTDAMGNKVSSGIFFVRVSAPKCTKTIKLVYLK